jgi:hypothetical protein
MSKKISEMTPTGEAPATSELAIAYNGENYKINPAALGGGGGIQAVRRFQQSYIGNNYSEAAIGLNARDGNLTPGKWIGYKTNYVGVSWTSGGVVVSAYDPIISSPMSQDLLIALVSSASDLYGMTTVANRSEFEPYMSNPESPKCDVLPYATIDYDGITATNGVSNTAAINAKTGAAGSVVNFNQPETIWYNRDGSLSVGGIARCAYKFNVAADGSVSITNKAGANARWLGNSVYFLLKYSN